MTEHRPKMGELQEAREQFRELLSREDTSESEYQSLFSRCPFILSTALPLQLFPTDIVPQGKPGERGADFLIYPQPTPLVYGAIEIKRPSTSILGVPRKDTIVLSRDSATALAQARESARRLRGAIEGSLPLCAIGGSEYLFLIVGLATELHRKVDTDHLRQQLTGLLPANCKLLPYDTLLNLFERTVPPPVYLLKPASGWVFPLSDEWSAAAKCCIEYIQKNARPDSPAVFEIIDALREAGHIDDFGLAHKFIDQLVKDQVLGEYDSLYPPFETLYFVRYRPGQKAPKSGIYQVTHDKAHQQPHEEAIGAGHTFAPCAHCGQGVRYVFWRTEHVLPPN
jgi:hypothetical protein